MSEDRFPFLVIQEGGTSTELYTTGWDTREEAEAHRIDCRDDGSYRTTEVIELPPALQSTDAINALEEVLASLSTLDYPGE